MVRVNRIHPWVITQTCVCVWLPSQTKAAPRKCCLGNAERKLQLVFVFRLISWDPDFLPKKWNRNSVYFLDCWNKNQKFCWKLSAVWNELRYWCLCALCNGLKKRGMKFKRLSFLLPGGQRPKPTESGQEEASNDCNDGQNSHTTKTDGGKGSERVNIFKPIFKGFNSA